MKIGTACAICLQINSEKYTDGEKGSEVAHMIEEAPAVGAYVDGETINAGVWYTLRGGKFAEV